VRILRTYDRRKIFLSRQLIINGYFDLVNPYEHQYSRKSYCLLCFSGYFNKQYGSRSINVPVIGNETFSHTIGHPETYPQREDVPYSSDLYLTPPDVERSVGQGNQYDSLEISRSDTVGSGFEMVKSLIL